MNFTGCSLFLLFVFRLKRFAACCGGAYRNILMLRVKISTKFFVHIQFGMGINIHHDLISAAQISCFVESAIRHTASDLCQKITPYSLCPHEEGVRPPKF